MSKKKKARTQPTMGELWVMMATVLAFQKAHGMGPFEYFSDFARNEKRLFRKIEAWRRDPANREAIIAEHCEAAKQIGLRATKQ